MMPKTDDPKQDLYRLMDEAGLTGALLQTKGPFMKAVVDVRQSLAVKLVAYMADREARREGSVSVPVNVDIKK